MAVYRVNKTRGYTVMANFHLRDKNLSLKAVGLLSKMLSFNDGWKFSTRGLASICKEGPDAIRDNLELDILAQNSRLDMDRINEMVEIMLDVVCSTKPIMRYWSNSLYTVSIAQRKNYSMS